MRIDPSIFRDYDIRATVPDQLDAEGVSRIAEALCLKFSPKSCQVGRDMRLSSPEFQKAFMETMLQLGVDVVDLGLISTDMAYYAAGTYDEDLIVMFSASHNPSHYNGLKIVKKGAIAVSGDSGIYEIKDLALSDKKAEKAQNQGKLTKRDIMPGWVDHVFKLSPPEKQKPFKIVVDAGNGMAGHFMPKFQEKLTWQVTELYYKLDGSFPNHDPSPIEEKNMVDLVAKVKELGADVGMAFDGDGDRVFLVDETGRTLSGTIITAIIAENLLQKSPGQMILYNAIVGRVVPEVVEANGGKSKRVRVGHTLIKEAMRKYDALFCGEHSGHYFFKDNFFADSAIISGLLVLEMMSLQNIKLSELAARYDKYFDLGEINFEVEEKQQTMEKIEAIYQSQANSTDWLDGVTVWFDTWWFNVRPSNTEPLLRLNAEADSQDILDFEIPKLISALESMGAKRKV